MSMMDLSEIKLTHLVTHFIGNKSREEGTRMSSSGSRIKQDALIHLIDYFLMHFKPIEFFNFYTGSDVGHNDVHDVVKRMFNDTDNFVPDSQVLAELLYDRSEHPKIKDGKFHVMRMEEANLDGEIVEVIGLFKSETLVPFLKVDPIDDCYSIDSEWGFDLKGMDKGCLIFKTDEDQGYRIVIHNANRLNETKYWNDEFLQIRACSDEYHQTKDIMNITKEFIAKKIDSEFDLDKTEKIDLLNKSVDYFKRNDSFDKKEFTETVFQDERVINSFENFDDQYRQEQQLEPVQSFEISDTAVKRQARVFKSVLKLDKNFHVYIHGDKSLIERGEEDGRKFYKIFFDQEA